MRDMHDNASSVRSLQCLQRNPRAAVSFVHSALEKRLGQLCDAGAQMRNPRFHLL